jgi:hypothetical protein
MDFSFILNHSCYSTETKRIVGPSSELKIPNRIDLRLLVSKFLLMFTASSFSAGSFALSNHSKKYSTQNDSCYLVKPPLPISTSSLTPPVIALLAPLNQPQSSLLAFDMTPVSTQTFPSPSLAPLVRSIASPCTHIPCSRKGSLSLPAPHLPSDPL